jgi:Fe2+ transport system protein FeoA
MISPTTSVPIPVELLDADSEGVVVEMCGADPNVHRLQEMGIRCGCRVRMLRPGEPCLLSIEGRKMCLRLGTMAEIFVCPVAS